MASPGQNFNDTVLLAETPDVVSQSVIAATTNVPNYAVTTVGAGSIILTRKYTPTWAIVVAVVGIVLFLFGLLALLYKNTETLSVTLIPTQGGTKVTISGVGSQEMLGRVASVLSAMPRLDGPEQLTTPVPAVEPADAPGDYKICPQCAEQVKQAARICRYCQFDFGATTHNEVESKT